MKRYFEEEVWTVDREATARAYADAPKGGADKCDCAGCRNFRVARQQAFPADFLAFLEELGVDFRKEGETFHCGRAEPGRHRYGGWYHFIGRLEASAENSTVAFGPDFEASLNRANSPRLSSLGDADLVEVNFFSHAVPWLLDEPELE